MAERVPEFALILGFFLGLVVLLSGLLFTDDPATTALVALAVSLPLLAHAVYHSDDPTTVLPPSLVLKSGLALAGAALLALSLGVPVDAIPLTFFVALLVALAVALAATAYYVGYGERRYGFPPGKVVVLTTLVAAALLAFGLLIANALHSDPTDAIPVVAVAALDALLIFLAGGAYAAARGLRPRPAAGRLIVGAGAAVGVAVAGVGLLLGSPGPWVVAGVAAVLGPALLVALAHR